MELLLKIEQVIAFLNYLETSIVSCMKKAELRDIPDSDLRHYETLGYILASIRDLQKELKDYATTDSIEG